MCIRCSGGTRMKKVYVNGNPVMIEHEIKGDGKYQRHTTGGRRPAPSPDPVEHGTLRGVRWHRGLRVTHPDKDMCDACSEFEFSDEYYREMRLEALAKTNRWLDHLIRQRDDPNEDADLELLEFYEKKRASLERLLRGDGEKREPAQKEETEPLERIHLRLTVRQIEALRERAATEGGTLNGLVRRAVDAWLVL